MMKRHITKKKVEALIYWMDYKSLEEIRKIQIYLRKEQLVRADELWPDSTKLTLKQIAESDETSKKAKRDPKKRKMDSENETYLRKFISMSDKEIKKLDDYEMSLYEDSYLAILSFANNVISTRKWAELKYLTAEATLQMERDKMYPTDELWDKTISEIKKLNKEQDFDFDLLKDM